jgi:hypothetical protein
MRHRAAVGLSEETDAVIIVVSEETGAISAAYNGRLHRYSDKDNLQKIILRWLRVAMPTQRRRTLTVTDWVSSRVYKLLRRVFARDTGGSGHAR